MKLFFKRFRVPIILAVLAAGVLAFLAYRPDKLFFDDPVDESLAEAFTTTTVGAAQTAAAPDDPTTTVAPNVTTTEASATTTTQAPALPTPITTGSFYGIDHAATGTATVYEQGGQFVLRFEDDTDIQNGPDLFVWLLPEPDYDGGDPDDYIDLGKIKGNVGGQNYDLPAAYDPDIHRTVLVWCLRFSVPFAAAPLR